MTARDYSALTREELEERLDAAENVCAVAGWTRIDDSPRGAALHELWLAWQEAGGDSAPAAHPHLGPDRIGELAARRAATRAATLKRLGGLS